MTSTSELKVPESTGTTRKVCMLCGKEHKVQPPRCRAKTHAIAALAAAHGVEGMDIMFSAAEGQLDLEASTDKLLSMEESSAST